MQTDSTVFADLRIFWDELRAHQAPYQRLLVLKPWRPAMDAVLDCAAVVCAVCAVVFYGWWVAPLAILIIGNRQRALGNLLHDAGHRNLHRSRAANDLLAQLAIAPLLFADFFTYRDTHLKHHVRLGSALEDPDHLPRHRFGRPTWMNNYARLVLSPSHWYASVAGHLVDRNVATFRKLYVVAWWFILCTGIALWLSSVVLVKFVALWLLARATTFHAITMFREMCDHFGLLEGGVLSFTRDVLHGTPWYTLVHPRNNGYHLTHHLLPAVPYYNLPAAQKVFASMPTYKAAAHVCDSYVLGDKPVVLAWSMQV